MWLARALLVLAFAVCGGLSHAADIPPLAGVFNDPHSVVSVAKRDEIIKFLREQEQKTSNQIVVLVVKTLDNEPVEDFANRVFQRWKLGQTGKDNGVLMVVASQDGKARIEVGRGLQGALPDILAKRILEDKAIPNFQKKRFGSGILESVQAIDLAVKGEYKPDPPKAKSGGPSTGLVFVVILGVVLLVAVVLVRLIVGVSAPASRLQTESAYPGPVRRSATRQSHASSRRSRRRDDDYRSRSDDSVPVFVPISTGSSDSYQAPSSHSEPEPSYTGGGGQNDGGGASASWSSDSSPSSSSDSSSSSSGGD